MFLYYHLVRVVAFSSMDIAGLPYRPFAKWEFAEAFKLPPAEAASEKAQGNLPREETIAEMMDKDGKMQPGQTYRHCTRNVMEQLYN